MSRARQSRPLGGEGDGGPHNSTCGPSPYRLVTTPPFGQPCGPQPVGTALVAVTSGGQPTDCCVAEVLAQPPHSASEKSDGSRRLGMNVVPRKHGSQMVWQPQDSERRGGSLSCPATKCDRKKAGPQGREAGKFSPASARLGHTMCAPVASATQPAITELIAAATHTASPAHQGTPPARTVSPAKRELPG